MTHRNQGRETDGKFGRALFGGGGPEYEARNGPPTPAGDIGLKRFGKLYTEVADAYVSGAINAHLRANELARAEGLGRSGTEVGFEVRRAVHRDMLAAVGDPRETAAFAQAVASVERGSFSHDGNPDFDTHIFRIRRELLTSTSATLPPGGVAVLDAAIADAVRDAA